MRPVLREHCFTCHNQNEKKGGLALDSYGSTMAGGSSGEVVFAGDLDSSRLWALVNHDDQPHMPPNQDKLAAAKLDAIKTWIEGGALENAGSKAAVKKKASLALAAPAGGGRPENPAMPEGLWKQPLVSTQRRGAITALAASPWAPVVAVAGYRQIALVPFRLGPVAGRAAVPGRHAVRAAVQPRRGRAAGRRRPRRAVGLRGAVRRQDGPATGQGRRRTGCRPGGRHQRHAHPHRAGRPATAGAHLLDRNRRIAPRDQEAHRLDLRRSSSARTACCWPPATGPTVCSSGKPTRPANTRTCAATRRRSATSSWRPDSNVLASGSLDGTVILWEMNEGKNDQELAGPRRRRDERRATRTTADWPPPAATGPPRSGTANGKLLKDFPALPDMGLKVAFTHDGKRLVAGDWSGQVRLWEAADAKPGRQLSPYPPTLAAVVEGGQAQVQRRAGRRPEAQAELAPVQQAANEKAAAVQAATEQAVAAAAAAQKAETEKTAATQAAQNSAAALKAATDALAAAHVTHDNAAKAKGDADKANQDKATAAKTAADKLAADNPQAAKTAKENASADKQLADAKAALDKAAAAKAEADKLEAERQGQQPLPPDKEAAIKTATEKAKAAAEAKAKAEAAVTTAPPAAEQKAKAAQDAAAVAAALEGGGRQGRGRAPGCRAGRCPEDRRSRKGRPGPGRGDHRPADHPGGKNRGG